MKDQRNRRWHIRLYGYIEDSRTGEPAPLWGGFTFHPQHEDRPPLTRKPVVIARTIPQVMRSIGKKVRKQARQDARRAELIACRACDTLIPAGDMYCLSCRRKSRLFAVIHEQNKTE